ncbi:LOW QUALITY PROTEIN: pendrin-like [Paramacrobiotus metropolitanus]|uniref:LOW QUALITY PROTEIN: pendrin-like n=1 Tax=Paramacrobiotus metropolitanus TaxID=2943436 RepID=UPI002445C5FF|nr:LOW QUALITY PROTEIN: pendrin-like [Paramacrobiotus metropolitanus]
MSEAQQEPHIATPWSRLVNQLRSRLHSRIHGTKCTPKVARDILYRILPITDWLFHYNIKKCLVGDLISGFTVGILNIPQGMAYGVLAGTESIYGLYTSFFPVLIYSLICTSQHASVGTFAVTSLMTGGIVHSVGRELYASRSNVSTPGQAHTNSSQSSPNDLVPMEIRVEVMMAITLATGIWEILFGIFRFGHLAVFLSDHLVKGFTCAAAFHVFTSQVKLVFGMRGLNERYGPLKLIYFYYDFFAQITTVHIPTLIVSIICITILYLVRTFINQNPRIMKIIKIPLPIELIVIIFATLASHYLDLSCRWGVSTVSRIPTGLPAPQVPSYKIIPEILGRSFSLAIVASAILISLTKIFSSKHHYKVDANQELIALGAANVFGAFFWSIPATGALARSAVQESVGGSTQVVSYVSAVIVLIVLVALGKYLEPLPRAVLGSVIMVALIGMLKQVTDVVRLWKISLIDASIFIVTFLGTLLLDVDLGLAIGVLYSLLTFAFRMQYGKVAWLGRVRGTKDDIQPVKSEFYAKNYVDEMPGVKIVRLYGPLYSGNAERFVKKIKREIAAETVEPATTPEPVDTLHRRNTAGDGEHYADAVELQELSEGGNVHTIRLDGTVNAAQTSLLSDHERHPYPLRAIIIDCSAISFVDVMGAEQMKQLAAECGKKGLQLMFAACTDSVRDVLILSGISTLDPAPFFVRSVLEALHNIPMG